ncbi:hypothetical protein [Listeria booriae]|uniref:Uncharacterized protein n=2 Tax=Listeria booriae TaxID=1552123 RepID=A0A841YQ37_9LIST|nr:hypothetical protein [Listeria booriae]MBC1307646.1 hypothetical protein [Listeria booriae]MBC1402591.1 hypothetical protein [Listeria booriae]MBC1616835.1 hypothetical protein [Listeria booriae]
MKKTLSILLITTLILPVSLSNVQAEETDSPSSQNNESAFSEENIIESPFESPEMTPPQNVNLRVALPVGPVMNWKQVGSTTYYNSVLANKVDYYGRLALVGGMTATVGGKIATSFAQGAVGAILGSMTARLMTYKAPNYWIVTKKYYAKDAVNVYIKTDFQVYSNSARTKLAYSNFQINKYYSPK